MSSFNLASRNPEDGNCRPTLDHEVSDRDQTKTCWEPSDWDPSSEGSFIVLVAEGGCQILIRHEGDVMSVAHDFKPSKSYYEHAKTFGEQVRSYFGITAHTHVAVNAWLRDFVKDYSYQVTVVEVTDDACSVGAPLPFVWIDWRKSALDFNRCCPHSHIGRFLVSYLSNKSVEEVYLEATPWRQLGFYNTMLQRLEHLVSGAGYEMNGNPEQVHYGSLSTVYEVPTSQGFLFCKFGFKGNGEPLKTKVITEMFPNDTPRVLGEDGELELMISEDHGPSVGALYCVRRSDRPPLNDSELKPIFGAALRQLARIQKESVSRVQELAANGIPAYDMQWIRTSFSDLITYMSETELDAVHPKVLGFGQHMERTFEIWERLSIPNTLVHGDLHDANIAQPHGLGTKFIFFDWDSSFIGHPFLDLARNDMDIVLGEETYLECWKEYGDIESLKKLVVWTRPMYFMIDAARVMRKDIWTDRERRLNVEYCLEMLVEALEECDLEDDWGLLGA